MAKNQCADSRPSRTEARLLSDVTKLRPSLGVSRCMALSLWPPTFELQALSHTIKGDNDHGCYITNHLLIDLDCSKLIHADSTTFDGGWEK